MAFLSQVSLQGIIKNIFFVAVVIIFLYMAYQLMLPVYSGSNAGQGKSDEILLFFISCFSSWMISAWFATFTSTDKIDTVAEQSFDKMSKLTVQLEQAKVFLAESIQIGSIESKGRDDTFARKALEHRIAGTIKMLDLIATSNEALSSDWLGVVSGPTQRRLREKIQQLSSLSSYVEEGARNISEDVVHKLSKEIPGADRLIRYVASGNPPALVRQTPGPAGNEKRQEGVLEIEVIRDTWSATGTGKLAPQMVEIPEGRIDLIEHPKGLNTKSITYRCGVGTAFDFNVNLRSSIQNVYLPLGKYVFKYEVKVPQEASGSPGAEG